MEMLGEFYPEGDNNVFLLCVCLIPVSLSYENEKEETARLRKLTAAHANTWKYADARVHGDDRLYSDTDKVPTREQAHTVGEDIMYVLVRDSWTFMLFLILERKLMDQVWELYIPV